MNIQVLGRAGDFDTQKAVRFFKERRISIHFVDLKQKAASKGELRRFVQKFGTDALIDRALELAAEHERPLLDVLYVHDGQNLFDPEAPFGGWKLQESLPEAMMVVGRVGPTGRACRPRRRPPPCNFFERTLVGFG